MKAAIETLSGVLRIWHDPIAEYGMPYDWAATVRFLDPTSIEIVGITKAPTQAESRVICDYCTSVGITRIKITRIKNGNCREHWIRTKRKDAK